MSSTPEKNRMKLGDAVRIADDLEAAWASRCNRFQIAGSVRRRCHTVGDIEIVCVPKEHGLFSEGLQGSIDEMLSDGRLKPGRCNGQKYQQYLLPLHGMLKLDLFLTTQDSFGLILAIRTGPWRYSREIVTQRHKKGRLRDGLVVAGGQLRTALTDTLVPTPDEYDFLDTYAGGWIAPSQRR